MSEKLKEFLLLTVILKPDNILKKNLWLFIFIIIVIHHAHKQDLHLQCISCLCMFTFQSIDDKFVKDLAGQTSGFMPRDILALVADSGVSFAHKIAAEKDSKGISDHEEILPESSSATQNEEIHFCKEDILCSLERAKKRNRAALGTPKVNILILTFRTSSR